MVKFTLNLPMELSAIQLHKYQKYLSIVEQNKDAEDRHFLNMKAVEIFCEASLKDVKGVPAKLFSDIVFRVNALFDTEHRLVQKFDMTDANGKTITFGFIPKLEDMSFGEFLDLESFIVDWSTMHKAMAVLYRPITNSRKGFYQIEEYEGSHKYSEIMRDAPVNIALGAMVFFYHLGRDLLDCMMSYLEGQMKDNTTLKETLAESGDGTRRFINLHQEMSQNLKKLKDSLQVSV